MAFDMQENNKVGFDMTEVKVGDKLVRRDGTVVELDRVRSAAMRTLTAYPYVLNGGETVTKDGCYWDDGTESDFDIIGFAREQSESSTKDQQANCTFTETQAVELLLSLGYTLKKGSN